MCITVPYLKSASFWSLQSQENKKKFFATPCLTRNTLTHARTVKHMYVRTHVRTGTHATPDEPVKGACQWHAIIRRFARQSVLSLGSLPPVAPAARETSSLDNLATNHRWSHGRPTRIDNGCRDRAAALARAPSSCAAGPCFLLLLSIAGLDRPSRQ